MKTLLAHIAASRTTAKSPSAEALIRMYLTRASQYLPCQPVSYPTEAAFFAALDRQAGRTAPHLILLDPRGKALTSALFAAHLGSLRDSGTQTIVFAVGSADGWSAAARERARLLLSFGPMTLPHELARVVLAEQIYRALTILAGHPYHCGH